MQAFLAVGAVGVVLVVVALVFGDVLDGLLPGVALGDSGGLFSTEVIGAFLAAFGLGAALLHGGAGLSVTPAAGGGLLAGLAVGSATFAFSRSLLRMSTDPTPRSADLVGSLGRVVTRIPAGGYGQVALTHGGHRLKLSACSDEPVAAGMTVVVVEVTSATAVLVTPADL